MGGDAAGRAAVRVPYEWRLALRYLRVHRGRRFLSIITLISVAGVAVGTAALVIALALMAGFEEDVRQRIRRGSAHLQVLARDGGAFTEIDPLVRRIEALPGVRAASPVLFTPAMITNEAVGMPAYAEVLGVDPAGEAEVVELDRSGLDVFAPLAVQDGAEGIVLGVDLAAKLGAAPGDEVRIVAPKVRLTPFVPLVRSRVLRVVGTFRSDAYPQDAQRAYVALDAAARLLDLPSRASWIEVRLDDPEATDAMRERIEHDLGPGWVVSDLLLQNSEILKAMNTERLILFLAIALIVVVASLNIVSTLILMVNDKVKEIGTLTAMGARPGGIARVFVLQGLVIGAVGTISGLTIGTLAARWLDATRAIPLDPNVYFMDHVPFATRPTDAVWVGAVAMGISLVATLYPAWRAAKLQPVEAIRHE